MDHATSAVLTPWENFYVIIGSSASALTGLVFVVITLVSSVQRLRSQEGTATFTTPTVVHFGGALLAAAALTIPWPSLLDVAVVLALAGLFGVIYVLRTAARIRRMDTYDADAEDWSWHTLIPLLAYIAMAGGAAALPALAAPAMFAFAFAVMALIMTGIHNAWDIVTFIAVSAEAPAANAPADDVRD